MLKTTQPPDRVQFYPWEAVKNSGMIIDVTKRSSRQVLEHVRRPLFFRLPF